MEKESQKPDFWQDKEKAIKISQKINQLRGEITDFNELERELAELMNNEEKIREGDETKVSSSPFARLRLARVFEKKLKEKELQVYLSGKHDKGTAILSIFAGAGGQDAQDWATLLLRMYERYCQRKGFKTKILHQSFGEPGPEGRIGTKQLTMEIKGPYAYGFLKKEAGVHRLVRISPFSAQKLRHTSFVLVEVMPEIPKTDESKIEIKPEDLKIDFYRASGPGGQYVNKRETAVRITHLPTKLQVACQSERVQGRNRQGAMKLLLAKLYQFQEEEKEKERQKIKGKKISAGWGNQIRSYVFHPYQMVKDLRTGVETSNVEEVLEGNLDQFIQAEIKL